MQNDVAQTQLLTTLMTDMLREVSSSIDNLAMGRIPHYLIPLNLVQNILTSATAGPASPIQTHLAFSMGSAIPLYVDPEAGDLAFLLSLPIIDSNNIYRLKDVVNVGFWQGNTYVKIHTPEVVAYHDNNEQLYLAPNLRMCTLTKDIHFLCPSKPFVRDNTEGICGLESIRPDTSCPAEATPRSQVEVRKLKSSETDGWSTPRHEQLPSHTINTTQPHALPYPTKLYGSLSLRARSSILTS